MRMSFNICRRVVQRCSRARRIRVVGFSEFIVRGGLDDSSGADVPTGASVQKDDLSRK